jgi:hypothetical protein
MKPFTKWSVAILLVLAEIVFCLWLRDDWAWLLAPRQTFGARTFLAETARSWAISAKAKRMTNPVHASNEVYEEARAPFCRPLRTVPCEQWKRRHADGSQSLSEAAG